MKRVVLLFSLGLMFFFSVAQSAESLSPGFTEVQKREFYFQIAKREVVVIMKLSEEIINKNLGEREASEAFHLEQISIGLFSDLSRGYDTLPLKEFQEKQKAIHAIMLELKELNADRP